MLEINREMAGIVESCEIVDKELHRLSLETVDERDVNAAFSDFGNVWNELNIREKSAVLNLLINRIEYDADEGSLSIAMHPAGIKTFSTDASHASKEMSE